MSGRKRRTLRNELASRHLYDDSRGKVQERNIIEGFLTRLMLTQCELRAGERPDFMISFDNGTLLVGCELTLFNNDFASERQHVGSPERRFHSQWKQVAKALRRRLDEEGGHLSYLYGSVCLTTPSFYLFDQLNSADLVEEIVEAIKKTDGSGVLATFDNQRFPLLSKFVASVYLRDCEPETGILWWCSHLQSGEIKDPNGTLVGIVAEKATKEFRYDWGEAREKWLLIYAAGTGLADLAHLNTNPAIAEQVKEIPFSHVFLWNKWSEDIIELFPYFKPIMSEGKTLFVNRVPGVVRPYLTK